jgi:hypothetical protein
MFSVIGISGRAGSGKDSVAKFLVEKGGWDHKIAFADNLKEMLKDIFSLTDDDLNTEQGKGRLFLYPIEFSPGHLTRIIYWISKTHPKIFQIFSYEEAKDKFLGHKLNSVREMLQFVGTDVCRHYFPHYHIDVLKSKLNTTDKYVISDVRFVDEVNFIKSIGGLVIRIHRDVHSLSAENINRNHISETQLNNVLGVIPIINNDSTLQGLFLKVKNFIDQNLGGKECPEDQMISLSGARATDFSLTVVI